MESLSEIVGLSPPLADVQSSLLIRGGPGTGKTVLALHLLMELHLANETTWALHLTTAESTDSVVRRLHTFWPDRPDLRIVVVPFDAKMPFDDWCGRGLFLLWAVAREARCDVVPTVEELAHWIGAGPAAQCRRGVVVVDDIIGPSLDDPRSTREMTSGLASLAERHGFDIILVDGPEDGAQDVLGYAADNVVSLRLARDTGMRQLQVTKSRMRPLNSTPVTFAITASGIVAKRAQRLEFGLAHGSPAPSGGDAGQRIAPSAKTPAHIAHPRDLRLMSLLLQQLRDGTDPPGLAEYTEAEQIYNAALLVDDGYAEGDIVRDDQGRYAAAAMTSLTRSGHDLLDSAMHASPRSPEPPVISESLARFREDHPPGSKTAFIMMQFGTTPLHRELTAAIRESLSRYGVSGLRADDKQYHDYLFPNVLTYIYGCTFGIAVFESLQNGDFNPNVSLEVGYAWAIGKNVCLLKDGSLPTLHTDLAGRLYKQFDAQSPESTISEALAQWLRDKGITA